MGRDSVKAVLQRSGLFPAARAAYRALNRSICAQRSKEIAFYAALLPPSATCFDVGANLGQKAEVFLACGARVIIIEPNANCLPALTFQFGKNPKAQIVSRAVGSAEGSIDLYTHGTDSTASVHENWDSAVFGPDRSMTKIAVPVTTLDILISQFGLPDFIKIDVEGFEVDVLRGLSRPIKLLSFEYHRNNIARLSECLVEVGRLGRIVVRASDMNCNWTTPITENAEEFLDNVSSLNVVGDVFVWLLEAR